MNYGFAVLTQALVCHAIKAYMFSLRRVLIRGGRYLFERLRAIAYFGLPAWNNGTRVAGSLYIRGDRRNISIGVGVRFLGDARLWVSDSFESTKISLGGNCIIDHDVSIIEHGGYIVIEPNVHIGIGAVLQGKGGIFIGRDSLLGPGVKLFSSNHITKSRDVPIRFQGELSAPISIGEDSWIGANVVVLAGASLGKRSIVAAGCVVNEDAGHEGAFYRGKGVLGTS